MVFGLLGETLTANLFGNDAVTIGAILLLVLFIGFAFRMPALIIFPLMVPAIFGLGAAGLVPTWALPLMYVVMAALYFVIFRELLRPL